MQRTPDKKMEPMETIPIPAQQKSKQWWHLRQSTLATTTVTGGAVIVALLTLGTVEERLRQMRIETAFVSQPIEPIVATDWGTLQHVYVQEGDAVAVGDPLVRVERNLEIQDELARLEGLILAQNREKFRLQEQKITLERERQQAHVNLEGASAAIHLEQQQIPARVAIEHSRVNATQSDVNSLAQRLDVARTRRDRFQELVNEGAIAPVAYDETVAEVARLEGDWLTAQENLTIAQAVVTGTERGDFVDRDQLQGPLPTLQLQQTQAQERLGIITSQLRSLTALLDNLEQELATLQIRYDQLQAGTDLGPDLSQIYTAPVAGIVTNVPRSPGNSVSRGASLVVLQHQEELPQITVYLTHDQAQQLAMNQPAQIYDPVTGNDYPADVTDIDWTGGRVDSIIDPLTPVNPTDIVSVQPQVLIHLTLQEESLEIPNGSPVVVTLKKRNDLLRRLAHIFRGYVS